MIAVGVVLALIGFRAFTGFRCFVGRMKMLKGTAYGEFQSLHRL
jgi:hypothetical protein